MKKKVIRVLVALSVLGNLASAHWLLDYEQYKPHGGGWVRAEGQPRLLGVYETTGFLLERQLEACGPVTVAKDGRMMFRSSMFEDGLPITGSSDNLEEWKKIAKKSPPRIF